MVFVAVTVAAEVSSLSLLVVVVCIVIDAIMVFCLCLPDVEELIPVLLVVPVGELLLLLLLN